MPSPTSTIPDDAFHEEAITAADLGQEGPEFDPQYMLVQSVFGLHVKPGHDGDEGLRSENDIVDLVRRLLGRRKSVDLHFEF